ncbi:beta-ketoacyl-ACP synthase II [Metallumcola ferriviriculae]|uniref:3-oxoacyl-[acyl-carrier-protein] synthase 2 n=1 Tax=Metallumcola ferriviriculae TaxID=3039180 RepID=A0AAU0UNK7_9FIRM|nr:beta-ketoacyl-ACP synthase II [Desulfitibacteraceae bacterium MK1]
MKHRVVVTGMGPITPVGSGKDNFWNNLLVGQSGVDHITRFDASDLPTRIAGEVKDFDPKDYFDRKEARRMDRFTQFAVAGTRMAVKDSGIDLDSEDMDQVGVIFGSGIGGMQTFEEQTKVLIEKGAHRVSPFFVPMMIGNMAAGQISIDTGARGPNLTVVNACATGTNAIGEAYKLLQRGAAQVVITGGSEASVTPLAFAGFCAMRAMTTDNDDPQRASRPFDKTRNGFVLSEGTGVLILETLEHAQQREANIYAEVVGYGCTADAHHITAPAPEGTGAAKAMNMALKDANLFPEDVDYINAHGTSTELNDKFESMAIKKVFGDNAKKLAISSTKSMTGHLLGAAGAIEAIILAMAITNSKVPPTINYHNPDPECDLDYVANECRELDVSVALSNSLGFGGHNATIIFKKFRR